MNDIQIEIVVKGTPHPRPQMRDGALPQSPRTMSWRVKLAAAIHEKSFEVGEAVVELLHEGCMSVTMDFRIPVQGHRKHWIGLGHHHPLGIADLHEPVAAELAAAKLLPKERGRISELTVRKHWCAPKDAGCTILLRKMPAPFIGIRYDNDSPKWLKDFAE